METSPRQQQLLATDAWAWLEEFIATWYARPLTAEDGCSEAQLAQAAERVGGALPTLLAEWFALVGNRLEDVQDHPVPPRELGAADSLITVWLENQGVWSIDADADGMCHCPDAELPFAPAPLPEVMRGLLLSDTLVGVWSAGGRGPLGELAPSVEGGLVGDVTAGQLTAIRAAFPEIAVPRNPLFADTPLHGDAATFLRGSETSGFGLEWMSASPESRRRIEGVLALEPPEGEYVVEVVFERLTQRQVDGVLGPNGAPDLAQMARAIGTAGHVGAATTYTNDGVGVAYRITTRDVDSVLAALDASSFADLASTMIVAAHPARLSRFEVLRPADGGDYRTPF